MCFLETGLCVVKGAGSRLDQTQINKTCGTIRGHFCGCSCFLESVLQIPQCGIRVRQEYLCVRVFWVSLKDENSAIFGFLRFTTNEQELTQV